MLDHVSIQCADLEGQRRLLRRRPGHDRREPDPEYGDVIGYGVPPKPDFWIGPQRTGEGFRGSHIAFSAPNRATVRAFFEAGKGCERRGVA